jgi:prepilin-type N-terminal cleavage/methylation domain-containing protein
MFKFLKFRGENSGGFTLIEVLVVASIIGILAAIAIPTLSGSRRSALEAACVKALRSLTDAEEMHYRDNFAYTSNWYSLDDYLPGAYSGWSGKKYFIENYSIGMSTSASNQRYTVFAWPTDRSLNLNTFVIMDDAVPLYINFEPVR